MSLRTQLAAATVTIFAAAATSGAAVLSQADFAGSGAVGGTTSPRSIVASDAQIATAANVTYDGGTIALYVFPNSATNAWVYDGTGTAATNNDVTDTTGTPAFGTASRLDVNLGLAAAGYQYTVTSAEITLRALNDDGISFNIGYRPYATGPNTGTPVISSSVLLTPQAGTAAATTYSIPLTGLSATDTTTSFDTTGTGRIRFIFTDSTTDTAADNLQIDAIRLIGTVTAVPEPTSLLAVAIPAAGLLLRRRHQLA